MTTNKIDRLKILQALEQKKKEQLFLPHIYHPQKLYKWQLEFFYSVNPKNFLTAANQIGKSSINIKKCIHWATDTTLWGKLWKSTPRQFWYLYPDSKTTKMEFYEKWVPEFLPRGDMKNHPVYGWTVEYGDRKTPELIRFNTGLAVYFKTYLQKTTSLQAGTVYAIFCDEELPIEHYDELSFRLSGVDGYFHMVFTATLNQEMWRLTMEEKGEAERFPGAFKRQISLYDCMIYADGSASQWTAERIKAKEADCSTETERLRRVEGRFVSELGLKYPTFDPAVHVITPRKIPDDWFIYSGIDHGSGGERGHPSAIIFLGVSPDYSRGEIFFGWRGDGIETTEGDTLKKYFAIRDEELKLYGRMVEQRYDYKNVDFKIMAGRVNEYFLPANKFHDEGEGVLNSLFKHQALFIHRTPELEKLVLELKSIRKDKDKREALDDLADAARYAITTICWDWSKIKIEVPGEIFKPPSSLQLRRAMFVDEDKQIDKNDVDSELKFWNQMYTD